MAAIKKGITKKEAKQVLADIHLNIKGAARAAKNVQTKDYLNIIADNLIPLEKLADQRTQSK